MVNNGQIVDKPKFTVRFVLQYVSCFYPHNFRVTIATSVGVTSRSSHLFWAARLFWAPPFVLGQFGVTKQEGYAPQIALKIHMKQVYIFVKKEKLKFFNA